MALDKLVDGAQLDSDLAAVANAIRAKSGGSGQLAFPAGFVSEIEGIETGGGGEWTTSGLSTDAEPNGDLIIDFGTTSTVAESGVLMRKNAHNVEVKGYRLSGGTRYDKKYFCFGLKCNVLIIDDIEHILSVDTWKSMSCEAVIFKKLVSTGDWHYVFQASTIAVADFSMAFGAIGNGGIGRDSTTNVSNWVFRRSHGVVTLGNDTDFLKSAMALKYTVYVPQALISSYQTATNWSTAYGYNANLFQPLEGSPYESPDWYESIL